MDDKRLQPNMYEEEGGFAPHDNPYGRPQGSSYDNPYGQGNPYGARRPSTGLGVASLVLGIFSLVFFCSCLNLITGILAIVFGILQLTRHKPLARGYAIGGIVTAILSLLLFAAFYVTVYRNDALTDSIMEQYQNGGTMPYDIEQYFEQFEGGGYDQFFNDFADPTDPGEDSPEFYIDDSGVEQL